MEMDEDKIIIELGDMEVETDLLIVECDRNFKCLKCPIKEKCCYYNRR